jgi:peptidyl-prolyl cis-trans isomerase SurA
MIPLAIVFALALGVPSDSTATNAITVDRVAAVVDDSPILLSEIQDRVQPEMMRQGPETEDPAEIARRRLEMMRAGLDVLINEKLLEAQLKGANIDIGEDQLQAAIDDVKRENHIPDDAAFAEALKREGYTLASYKEKLRRDLEKMKLLNLKVHNQAKVTDNDVREAYSRTYVSQEGEVEIHARHILVAVPRDAKPEVVATALQRATEISQRAKAGGDFAALAKQLSDGPSASQGGDLGYFRRGVMVAEFERVAFEMPVGAVSDPVRTQFGFHIIKIEDRRKAPPPPFDTVKDQIRQKLTREQIDRLTADYLNGLRKEATVEIKIAELKPRTGAGSSPAPTPGLTK